MTQRPSQKSQLLRPPYPYPYPPKKISKKYQVCPVDMQVAVVLTPACYDVEVETLALFEGGDEDNVMKVEALYKDPCVVGNDDVIKEGEHQLARPVLYISKGKKNRKNKMSE